MVTKWQLITLIELRDTEMWRKMLGDYVNNLLEQAKATNHVSLSPVHIALDYNPDPECFPESVKMLVKLWIDIES